MKSVPPLDGVVVLDLTRFVAGPYATMLLADAGAEVIKVEPPGGEETRSLNPLLDDEGVDVGGYFLRLNRRKKSVSLDLGSDDGREAFLALVRRADVVFENFRPGVMDRLGIGSDRLLEVNPELIYCSISGFGQTPSPYRQWPAFNLVPESMAGVLSKLPVDGEEPYPLGPPVGDLFPSMHALSGVLLALLRRQVSGSGSVIDIAMYDSMLSFNELAVCTASMTGEDYLYGLTVNPNLAPHGFFPAKDGWVCIAVGPDRQWLTLCEVMNAPDLAGDPNLMSGSGRVERFSDKIEPRLLDWLSTKSRADAAAELAVAGVPAAPVRLPSETLTCSQAESRQMLLDVEAPGGTRWTVPGNPIRMSPALPTGPAKTVAPGADTYQVLTDLAGIGDEAARALASLNPAATGDRQRNARKSDRAAAKPLGTSSAD